MIRVLVVGCGDVAMRAARLLAGRARLVGLTRSADDVPKLRACGFVPIVGDLDDLRALRRLRTAPYAVMHFAPPPPEGRSDPRTGQYAKVHGRYYLDLIVPLLADMLPLVNGRLALDAEVTVVLN